MKDYELEFQKSKEELEQAWDEFMMTMVEMSDAFKERFRKMFSSQESAIPAVPSLLEDDANA